MFRLLAAGAAIMIGTVFLSVAMVMPVGGGAERVGPTVELSIPGGHGSAVSIGNGYFLTAAHVVASVKDGKLATLRFDDGTEMTGIEIMWSNTKYDIALFRMVGAKDIEGRAIQCVDPKVGDWVTSEGNPLDINDMVTFGRVSSSPQALGHWASVYNMTAMVSPGMSGGPVFNEAGDIVGINVGMGAGMPIYLAVPGSVICSLMGRA
jgi:serine protease Do